MAAARLLHGTVLSFPEPGLAGHSPAPVDRSGPRQFHRPHREVRYRPAPISPQDAPDAAPGTPAGVPLPHRRPRGTRSGTTASTGLSQEPSPTDSLGCAALRIAPAGPGDTAGCGPESPSGQTADRSKSESLQRPRIPALKLPHPLPSPTRPWLSRLSVHPIKPTVVVIIVRRRMQSALAEDR